LNELLIVGEDSMPRSKEFDPTRALDQAMQLFWRQGYHATSMDDLVAALEVQRYGIYAAFNSKHDLFLAALDRYLATVVSGLLAHVEQPDAGLSEIQAYFGRLVAIAHTAAGEIGCLMCNSATELAPHDSAVAAKVDTYVQRLTSAFRGALTNAQQRGELNGLLEVDAAAHYLTGTVIGISVYVKTPVQRASIAQYAQLALSLLAPNPRQ
jgi:TetR/AcrR family transcriptional regulator, transcriptional repressor for nem operon